MEPGEVLSVHCQVHIWSSGRTDVNIVIPMPKKRLRVKSSATPTAPYLP